MLQTTKLRLALGTAALIALASPASANLLTNASFELPATTTFIVAPAIPGWVGTGIYGVWQPSTFTGPGFVATDGTQAGFLGNGTAALGTLQQTIGQTAVTGQTYTFSLDIGHRPGFFAPYTLSILAGSTDLASVVSPVIPADGTWGRATLTYTAVSGDSALGNLSVLIAITGPGDSLQLSVDQASFDQTNSEAIPEPAALAILGVGLLGLGLARRR